MATNYPNTIDTDLELPQFVDDEVTEVGSDVINPIREAVITIENVLGINPQGSMENVAARLAASLNLDGTIKPASLNGIGLISLPITNSMFNNSTISETKLVLDHSTHSLYTAIQGVIQSVLTLSNSETLISNTLAKHIDGVSLDGYESRHVASHVDINTNHSAALPLGIDPRDPAYNNSGLLNVSGSLRSARNVMDALIQINNDLLNHINLNVGVHKAKYVELDSSNFDTIPQAANTVQKAFDFIDQEQTILLEEHRHSMHSTGIPRSSSVELLNKDGYNTHFGPFACVSSANADAKTNKITFTKPSNNSLDWAFKQIKCGDYIKLNLAGFEVNYTIDKINYVENSTYEVEIDSQNIIQTSNALGVFVKSHYDDNYFGKLALAPSFYKSGYRSIVELVDESSVINPVDSSVIVISPNCPMVCGFDLALNEIDATHYMLYLGFYPTGNPEVQQFVFPRLPGIDITGNKGTTPGAYTLQSIIEATNSCFRDTGYNYRFVAFECNGQFGIAIADNIDGVGFSIVSSSNGTTVSDYPNNVIDIVNNKDALGLGPQKANVASPSYNASNIEPTKIFVGKKNKKYNINGQFIDVLGNDSKYFTGNLIKCDTNSNSAPYPLLSAHEGVYAINNCSIQNTKIVPGSTIVVMPITSQTTYDNNYGRFIVKKVEVDCDNNTTITVVDCVSMTGKPNTPITTPITNQPSTYLPVRIYCDDNSSIIFHQPESNSKAVYELYVKEDGQTYAHKRAKMPIIDQLSLQANQLNTSLYCGVYSTDPVNHKYEFANHGWRLVDVSSKFKGLPDAAATIPSSKRFIRLLISNIQGNSFDAQLCQSGYAYGITALAGPITSCTFNKVCKVYDQSGIDYIEIAFDYNTSMDFAGSIYPELAPGYIDIEIYNSLQNNYEYLLLGTCEFLSKFADLTNLTLVSNIKDKRQFGTVDEKTLSSSALSFIESGNRAMQNNSVIGGFDVASYTNYYITMNGGSAMVNGKIVNHNNCNIYIPQINVSGDGTQSFIVCLASDNNIVTLPMANDNFYTDIGAICNFTGNNGAISEFLKTYTVLEILTLHKEYIPLYIVTCIAGASSVTINTIKDIRTSYVNDSINADIIVSSVINNTKQIGTFSNLEAAITYAIYSGGINNVIEIRNKITITKEINMKHNIPLTLRGVSGNELSFTNTGKLLIGQNCTLDGLVCIKDFSTASNVLDTSNCCVGAYIESGEVFDNCKIINCKFISSPSVLTEYGIAMVLFSAKYDNNCFLNITIDNNLFYANQTSVPVVGIAFTSQFGGAVSNSGALNNQGTRLQNITISNNSGSTGSYLMLVSDNNSTHSAGLVSYGVKIINNNFDYLLFSLSNAVNPSVYTGIAPRSFENTIIIEGNNFITAATANWCSRSNITSANIASPSMRITNNTFAELLIGVCETLNNTSCGVINIENNTIVPSTNVLDNTIKYNSAIDSNTGIYLNSTKAIENNVYKGKVVANIIGNTFTKSSNILNITLYNNGIYTMVPTNISNNIFNNCITNTTGTFIYTHAVYNQKINIQNNIFSRSDTVINAYIQVEDGGDNTLISDNYFDSPTVNNTSNKELCKFTGNNTSAKNKIKCVRNKNQEYTIDLLQFIKYRTNDHGTYTGWDFVVNTIKTTTFSYDLPSKANGEYTPSYITLIIPNLEHNSPISISMDIELINESETSALNSVLPRLYASGVVVADASTTLTPNNTTNITFNLNSLISNDLNYFIPSLSLLFLSSDTSIKLTHNKTSNKYDYIAISNVKYTYRY